MDGNKELLFQKMLGTKDYLYLEYFKQPSQIIEINLQILLSLNMLENQFCWNCHPQLQSM